MISELDGTVSGSNEHLPDQLFPRAHFFSATAVYYFQYNEQQVLVHSVPMSIGRYLFSNYMYTHYDLQPLCLATAPRNARNDRKTRIEAQRFSHSSAAAQMLCHLFTV